MNIEPNVGKILIEKTEPETKSGSIIIPQKEEKALKGIVIAVGKAEKDTFFDIKPGDCVFFAKWGGTEISSDNNSKYVVIKADEILAIERK